MQPTYDAIYFAPHLDDVALSCGGQISAYTGEGMQILIVTVMAGPPPPGAFSPFANELHARWELPEAATVVRRQEDARACDILGADYLHWDIPDAVYRRDAQGDLPLYPTWEDVIHPHLVESSLIDRLTERMRGLPAANEHVVPLGVGNHVDHLVVRAAAERAFADSLVYYEDFPYAMEGQGVTAILEQDGGAWSPESISLNPQALHVKERAILAYRSQLSTFFTDPADLRRQLSQQAEVAGGERRWHRMSPLTKS